MSELKGLFEIFIIVSKEDTIWGCLGVATTRRDRIQPHPTSDELLRLIHFTFLCVTTVIALSFEFQIVKPIYVIIAI